MRIIAKEIGNKGVTGKPADIGGIPHELGSTGYGVYHSTKVAANHINLKLKGAKFAVEGFGNVGSFAAKFLNEEGAILVAASDSKGVIYNEKGLDVNKLISLKSSGKSVTDYANAIKINDIISVDCDIFIPAAQADVINNNNKSEVKAKIIVEGANIPMSQEIEEEFHEKGILIIPDFVANAGGVISSYVEYIGGKQEEVFPLVKEKVTKNTLLVLEKSKKESISPRKAATQIAFERLR
jgi:glutamate dehydrogenase (NAD(P)+)